MTFADALARVERSRDNDDALEELARAALAEGEEERALGLLSSAAERRGNARLWQWTGLLHRARDCHRDAIVAFEKAVRLAPLDPGIAHGHARTALEAGLPAVDLFDAALRLAPDSGEVIQGRAAALFADGRGRTASDDLAAILARNPTWIDGHATLVQLRALLDGRDAAMASFTAALAAVPGNAPLWQAAIETYVRAERFSEALDHTRRARAQIGDDPYFDLYEALSLSEQGETGPSDPLFARIADIDMPVVALWHLRHLIRTGRFALAAQKLEPRLGAADATFWPYAAAVWRAMDDPRLKSLEGDNRLVSVIDLADQLPPLEQLATVLRRLHLAQGEHLDQSVRGGTQTDGPLFSRIEPEIAALRKAVVKAVEQHIAQLPPIDAQHFTLAKRRDRGPRFAGSWSVQLKGDGRHANHVHPQGWISSALYVSLPNERERGGGEAGWLTLGQPQAALGLDLPPARTIEPKPGRLVLFPSTMWHGTIPFAAGERLTVAFDVAPPI